MATAARGWLGLIRLFDHPRACALSPSEEKRPRQIARKWKGIVQTEASFCAERLRLSLGVSKAIPRAHPQDLLKFANVPRVQQRRPTRPRPRSSEPLTCSIPAIRREGIDRLRAHPEPSWHRHGSLNTRRARLTPLKWCGIRWRSQAIESSAASGHRQGATNTEPQWRSRTRLPCPRDRSSTWMQVASPSVDVIRYSLHPESGVSQALRKKVDRFQVAVTLAIRTNYLRLDGAACGAMHEAAAEKRT
jgi:hypothetical protein